MNIKERALGKYPVRIVDVPDIDEGCPSFYTEDENAIKRHYYIKGATEQKAEDINKTCEWIERNLHLFIMSGSRQVHYSAFLQEFRKAMENNGLKDATQWIADNEFILAHQEENECLTKATLRLMDYMEAHHLSEEDIADIAGVNEGLVHKLIHGQLNVEIIKLMEK